MDYIKPSVVAETFLTNAVAKSNLPVFQLLLRGFLSGALLGFATTVAFTANAQGVGAGSWAHFSSPSASQ